MTIHLITHPQCQRHDLGSMHPEAPERLFHINDQLIASGLNPFLQFHDARQATFEDLSRVHSRHYLDRVIAKSPEDRMVWLDFDTGMMPHTLSAALHAAGSGLDAVDQVMAKPQQRAFCAVRPPGHHATADSAMGFCLFNNLAIAVAYAMNHYPVERVVILDFDVHHGNGIEAIFANDDRVRFYSSFQFPLFPLESLDTPATNTHHLPLAEGDGAAPLLAQLSQHWLADMREFNPDLVFIAAGFDAHAEDEMGGLNFLDHDYFLLTQLMVELANECCEGRLVSFLEGGYEMSALARSVVAHLKAMQ